MEPAKELELMEKRVTALRKIHRCSEEQGFVPTCIECIMPWPCRTIQVIGEAREK